MLGLMFGPGSRGLGGNLGVPRVLGGREGGSLLL